MSNPDALGQLEPKPDYYDKVVGKANELILKLGTGIVIESNPEKFKNITSGNIPDVKTMHLIDSEGKFTNDINQAVAVYYSKGGIPALVFKETFDLTS